MNLGNFKMAKIIQQTNKKVHLSPIIFVICYLITCTFAAWQDYTTFTGYLPSYIYPITLNPGDQLKGHLSWPGTQDLDIYLYSQGMDLLKASPNTSYIKRQFSQYNNPQIMEYNATAATTYFLRVDLYSNIPTPYQFNISVNGQQISNNFDTIIKVDAQRTAQQFVVNGPCQIRVIYDGPIRDLYLFAPGVSVITGTPSASNTSNVNPKQLTFALTSGGTWTLVVHHLISSTTTLTPFKIIVQTDRGVNECTNFCSNIEYSAGLAIGYNSTCRCADNFQWVASNSSCNIICSKYNSSGITVARLNGSNDRCTCSLPDYGWNPIYFMCGIDCTGKNFVVQANGNDSCECIPQFYWDAQLRQCIRDCSNVSNSVQVTRVIADIANFGLCYCQPNFQFNSISSECQINCSLVQNSVPANSTSTCQCLSIYEWNDQTNQCDINCFLVVNSLNTSSSPNTCDCPPNYYFRLDLLACVKNCTMVDPYSEQPARTLGNYSSFNICVCQQYFQLNPNTSLCQINCNLVPNSATSGSNGNNGSSIDVCFCVPQFFWLFDEIQCTRNCTLLNNTVQFNRTNSSIPFDACLCENKFYWNPTIEQCQINCSLIDKINTNANHGIDFCYCDNGYYWHQSLKACVIDCVLIQYAMEPNRTINALPLDSCECPNKFQWNNYTMKCQINCSSLKNVDYNVANYTQIDICACSSQYRWQPTILQCLIDCPNIQYTVQVPIINMTDYQTCNCIQNFEWNNQTLRCEVICQNINFTITNLSEVNASLMNFSQINQTLNNLTYDQCLCEMGFQWSQQSKGCQFINLAPSNLVTVEEMSWVQDDICSRKLNLTVSIPANSPHPIDHYTKIQLMHGQGTNYALYRENQYWRLENIEYQPQKRSVILVLYLQNDPIDNKLTIKFSSQSGGMSDHFYAYAKTPSEVATAVYSPEQCSSMKNIQKLIDFTYVSAYIVMGTGAASFTNKLIGLQLFGVLQLAYFSIAQHYSEINALIHPIKVLRVSNGAILNFYEQNQDSFNQYMPDVLKTDTKINGYFINNYNVMFLVLLGFASIFGSIYALALIYNKFIIKKLKIQGLQTPAQQPSHKIQQSTPNPQKSSQKLCTAAKVQTKAEQILKQGLLTLIIFSIFNISFSAGVFYQYCQQTASNQSAINISKVVLYSSFVIILAVVVDFVRTGCEPSAYGEFKKSFKFNWLCRVYVVISLLYRLVLGFAISMNLQDIYGTMFVLAASIVFIMYNIINLPFISVVHNYRANLMHVTHLVILFTANYYRSMKSNTPLPQKSHIHTPAIVMLIFVTISVIFSILVIFYEIFMKVKELAKKCKSNSVENANELTNQNIKQKQNQNQIVNDNDNQNDKYRDEQRDNDNRYYGQQIQGQNQGPPNLINLTQTQLL